MSPSRHGRRGRREGLHFWPAYVDLMVVLVIVGIVSWSVYEGSDYKRFRTVRKTVDIVMESIEGKLAARNITVQLQPDGIRLPDSTLHFMPGLPDPVIDDSATAETFEAVCVAIRESLDEMPQSMAHLAIYIDGHSDSTPIRSRTRERYPTNWELSTARAQSVRALLEDTCGLDRTQYSVYAMGYADTKPLEDRTESLMNRRIEIRIVPNYDSIMEEKGAGEAAADTRQSEQD